MRNTLFGSALLATTSFALDNGLGLKPQMGWNSWNTFKCEVSQDLMHTMADKIISLGLLELGYNYVNLDDCWQLEDRNAAGELQWDPTTFPDGMTSLAEYLHTRGLLFGIYSCAGTNTCAGRAGSLDHEVTDANSWASWGVDYLKYDNCFNNSIHGTIRYPAMRDALLASGRDIFYSVCNWGEEDTWKWGAETANSWRTTQDIFDSWVSVEFNFKESQKHFEASGSGGWNDPDMLEVGCHNGKGSYGLTVTEEKTHFALWSIIKAPLIIGADLEDIRQESLDILMTESFIAVNQDEGSNQANCYIGCEGWDYFWRQPSVYATTVTGGDTVAVVVNWRETSKDEFAFSLYDLGIVPGPTQSIQATDMWTGEVVGTYSAQQAREFSVKGLAGHGNVSLRLSLVESVTEATLQ